ncbi:MAG: hypothetical protein ACI94Y_004202 [Maribacter sp.]|jgi:hypothetical protein
MKQTLFLLLLSITTLQGQGIFINEIMSDNEAIIMDEDGDYNDWIEFFNNTDIAIDLSNYSLSDDIDDLDKWDFPTMQINAYSYLLIFASGKDKQGDELHSNFKISSDGEDILLAKNGIIIDQFFSVSLGEDVSFGRLPDAAIETYELNNPSPGSSNSLNDQLSFSHPQGFHSSPFYQKVESLTGHEIHFTTDGSPPTIISPIFPDSFFINDRTSMSNLLTEMVTTPPDLENEAAKWKSPDDLIDKAYTIRYASFYNGIRTSHISSQTYFIGEEMSDKYEMPVISLITESDGFFDEERGIYVPGITYKSPNINTTGNYYLRGREWERDVHITYFDENGVVEFSQDAGVRISGGVTRKLAQKSLRLYARDEYGAKHFNYPLLPQKSFDQYENFTLRTTMGAWYHHTIIKDDLANEIVRDMDLASQDYRPVIVFLNGEYWGIHTIKDRLDEKFIEYTYGIDRESVEMNNIWEIAII